MSEKNKYYSEAGRQIMRERLLNERKSELKAKLKAGKEYNVQIFSLFVGEFKEIITENGIDYVVFKHPGSGRDGRFLERKVPVKSIMSAELINI